jgi:5-methylcytosine-specific restriction protein B
LEYRDRSIDLMYASGDEGRDFTLPKNVYVIGTMNTADRSIALVDAAMRRRFAFLSLHPDDAHLHGVLREWLRRAELSTVAADLLAALNDRIPDRDFKIGPSYLMRTEAGTDAGLDRIWRTSILPLLEELHYGETGVVVSRRYGLAALRAALPNRPLEGAASAGGTGDTDLGA